MRISIGCEKCEIIIYVNDKKHDFYGYRARVEKPLDIFEGVWEDSRNSRAESIGKLMMSITDNAPKTRRGRW